MISKIKEVKEVLIDGKRNWNQKRSTEWPKIREAHLKNNPICDVCGSSMNVEVHHIKPFHLYPELELDPSNLISLCETKKYGVNCHLFFGHLGNYRAENPHLLEDVKIWKKRFEERKKQLKE